VSGAAHYIFVNYNHNNFLRAINERVFLIKEDGVFREPYKTKLHVINAMLKSFRDSYVKYVRHVVPLALEDIPKFYVGAKRTLYEKTVDELHHFPVTKEDARVKSFGKSEGLDATAKAFEDIIMRVVSPRSPRYGAALAIYIKAIEHRVYTIIDRVFSQHHYSRRSKTVCSGMNALQTAEQIVIKFDQFTRPVCIPMDATRFDQSVSRPMLQWEHTCYLPFFSKDDRKELARLLEMQLTNNCVAFMKDALIKYKVSGGRMSGDMNTKLGNCLIMCAMMYSYCIHTNFTNFALINCGDDCVLIIESNELCKFVHSDFSEYMRLLGFRIKVEKPVYTLEEILFCSTKPVWNGQAWVMVRSPFTSTSKDAICTKPFETLDDFVHWIWSVGKCGLALASGIPIQQEFYLCYIRNAERLQPEMRRPNRAHRVDATEAQTGFKMMAKGMKADPRYITHESRISFEKAWGITAQVQIDLEEQYRKTVFNWKGGNQVYNVTRIPFHFTDHSFIPNEH
jgi:hypothetical protein